MKKKNQIAIFLLGVILFACNTTDEKIVKKEVVDKLKVVEAYQESSTMDYFLAKDENWQSETKSISANKINYRTTEIPLAYRLAELEDKIDAVAKDSILSEIVNERILRFEFEHENKIDLFDDDLLNPAILNPIEYMSFAIKDDFLVLTEGGDTIPCAGLIFERNFKVTAFKRLLLYFNEIPRDETVELIYKDHIFQNGMLRFNFQTLPTNITTQSLL